MDGFQIFNIVLLFAAGLGAFLIGIGSLGGNLEAVAGSKLRRLFDKISNNRLAGVGIGAGVTAVIQSSSATTVMVVGFVNAGIMTLMQATPIIMGANIGTTITAFLVSLQSLNMTLILAAFACIGAFMMMSAKQNIRKIGAIFTNLGLIFIGLEVMGNSVDSIKEEEWFISFIGGLTNPFLLLLFGMILTALMQSSSAMTGILILLIGDTGSLFTLNQGIFMILGINIGTCITALLATIGTSTNAKRTAFIHFMFNTLGALLFFIPQIITTECQVFGAPHVGCFDKMLEFIPNASFQLSIFHLIFNISTTVILLPLTKQLVRLAELVVRDKKPKAGEEVEFVENKLTYIDERILETPAIAVNQITKEIILMASIAKKNLDLSIECLLGKTLDKQEKFDKREKQINFMNKELSKYLVKITSTELSYRDELKIASYYHVISDIERIGDYSENIMEYTESLLEDNLEFSEPAIEDIREMYNKVCLVYDNAMTAFENKDLAARAITEKYEEDVDSCLRVVSDRHLARLYKSACTSANGAIFISLVNNLERIADHMTNISHSITSYTKEPIKTAPVVKSK